MLFKLDVPLTEDPFADAATLAAKGGLPWAIHKTHMVQIGSDVQTSCTAHVLKDTEGIGQRGQEYD